MRRVFVMLIAVGALSLATSPAGADPVGPDVPVIASPCGQIFAEHGSSAHGNAGAAVSGLARAGGCKGGA